MPTKEEYAARKASLSDKWEAAVRQRQATAMLSVEPSHVELPSGLEVDAIRVNLVTIWEAGRIPDALTPLVIDIMKTAKGTRASAASDVQKVFEERFHEFSWLLDVIWVAAVTTPEFTLEKYSDTGKIPIRLVDLLDKLSLFNWCQGVTDHLAAFRGASRGPTRPVVDKPVVSEVHSSGAPGDQPSGEPLASVASEPVGDDIRPVGGRKARGSRSTPRPSTSTKVPNDSG